MIISNWIAKVVLWFARLSVKNAVGFTFYPFIFIYPKQYVEDKSLIRHESKHLEQYKRYWIVGFIVLYLYQFIKYGYKNMPLENEARSVE